MISITRLRPTPLFSKPNPPLSSEIWDKDLAFQKGKNYLIRAISGGGKSTFLHIILGWRTDYEGKVNINETSLSTASAADIAALRKDHLSIVFQDLKLIPTLSVQENIEATRSLTDDVSAASVQTMMQRLNITELVDQKVETLSYGQRQRVAIIRALVRPFSFLMLDEPFSHLDEENIQAACELIQEEVTKREAGLILVSHESAYHFKIDETFLL